MELEKHYIPKEHERRIYENWQKTEAFKVKGTAKNGNYSIVMPPPNVTGMLHIGHALNNTLQDILIRYHRHLSENSLWIPGMDHAGIATHTVVEKKLAKEEGKTRWDIGREDFVKEIWKWKEDSGDIIMKQLRRILVLPDWSKERFTLDEGLSHAVYKVFETLFEEGLIYKGNYIINWCPRCQTALADTEVEHMERNGNLWYIQYPLKKEIKGLTHLTVATTRPETMLGDTAVAVNPEDERYKFLIGETLILPIQDKEIPIIGDSAVEMEFGTGAVKVTPYHDPNDYEMGKRHALEFVKVIDEEGMMTGDIPPDFENLDRDNARTVIVKLLKEKGYLVRTEEHVHSVSTCYRCDTILEPLVSNQWFVSMRSLAQPAIKAVEDGSITFYPEKWKKYYLNWMRNIRDWCISRQLWWGHRIPVFYCDECDEKWVSKEVPQECPKCGSSDIRQDEDVLDTWFSSALWPFSTMGWPEKTELLSEYYPTSVLITDRGIIFNWVARMIMMGLKFMDKKPFFDVYIHGTILDEIGRKMSKSLGNGIDPIEMADKYGADAVRFSLISLTTFGQDISLSENKFQMGRNFSNKIWNAMRFILMNIDESVEYVDEFDQRTPFDKWIYSRFSQAAKKMKAALDEYNFSEYADTLYHFFWDEFCDWYIEASKKNLDKKETLQNLLYIAKRFLIYLNPAMPVLSEVLYDYLPKSFRSDTGIMDEPVFMPKKDDIDISGEELMASILEWITAVRRSRKEFNIKPSSELKVILQTDKKTEGLMFLMKEELTTFVKASALDFTMTEKPGSSINVIIKGITSYIPAQGLIDIEKERSRLKDQRAEVDKFISMSENKLSNKNFVSKAPKSVVEGVRETLKSNQELLKRIEENLESIQ